MSGSPRFLDDFSDVGTTVGFVVGLILLAMTVRELKRARTSLRGAQAHGRIVWAESSRRDRYGDTVEKVVDVQFTTASGARIKFTEKVGLDQVDKQQEVTVHYDPAHPMLSATIYPPRAALGRVIGYGVVALLLIGAFVVRLTLR